MSSEFLSSEVKQADAPFEPRKYRVSYRCRECGHAWKGPWRKAPAKVDPPCPNILCAEIRVGRQAQLENQRLRIMLEEQRSPAQIGANNTIKAVDFTAQTVMENYGMTDLKDNIREGESMAPKLPAAAQAAADGYFGTSKSIPQRAVDFGTGRMRTIQARHLETIGKRAMAGAYRKQAVAPVEVIPKEMRGKPPLQLVRNVKNPHYRGN